MCSHLLLPKLGDHKSNCTLNRLGKCYTKLILQTLHNLRLNNLSVTFTIVYVFYVFILDRFY